MIREICKDEAFLAQKAEPATPDDLTTAADLLELEMPLSSYTSRHTWATTARNHNVPLSVISAGMGHASEKTTQIYLASLESSVIDQANRSIIASLYV